MPISDDNLDTAWKLLSERYDHPRYVMTVHLNRILNTTPNANRTAKDLYAIVDDVADAINALRGLGCPVDSWDIILVYTVAQRLDPETRQAWRIKISSVKDYPAYAELKAFIYGQARALEMVELHNSSNPEQQKISR